MHRSIFALALTAFLLAGCQPQASTEEAEPDATSEAALPRAENETLGIALGAVPAEWEVVDEAGEPMRLSRVDGDGELWIERRSPAVGGVNLINMIERAKTDYEAMEEGAFHGQVELGTQFGTAFSVRGRFLEDDVLMEERQIFSVHPSERDKALVMVYRYPAGEDSAERTQEMLGLFTELEDLSFQQAPALATEPAME